MFLRCAVILLACCCAQLAEASPAKRRHPASRPVSLDVTPSPEVDARIADEVLKARGILENLSAANVFASPYLVSAFYYHDGFLDGFPVDRNTAAPERRIIGQISAQLTSEEKASFRRLLHEVWSTSVSPGPEHSVEPVAYLAVSGRRSHRYAVDLFAPEGATVSAVSRGVVVLADSGWSREDLFSTASRKGGNAVILFDPDRDRFYRYCHLNSVTVSPGEVVAAGAQLGSVGHSGLNASQAGHGRHLHFEANEYVDGHMRALDWQRLRTMLRNWRLPGAARTPASSPPARTSRVAPAAGQFDQ